MLLATGPLHFAIFFSSCFVRHPAACGGWTLECNGDGVMDGVGCGVCCYDCGSGSGGHKIWLTQEADAKSWSSLKHVQPKEAGKFYG